MTRNDAATAPQITRLSHRIWPVLVTSGRLSPSIVPFLGLHILAPSLVTFKGRRTRVQVYLIDEYRRNSYSIEVYGATVLKGGVLVCPCVVPDTESTNAA